MKCDSLGRRANMKNILTGLQYIYRNMLLYKEW